MVSLPSLPMNLRILPLSQPDRPARFGCFRPSRGLRGTSEAARLVLASPHVNDAGDALGSKMPPDLGKSARYHQQSMDFAPKKRCSWRVEDVYEAYGWLLWDRCFRYQCANGIWLVPKKHRSYWKLQERPSHRHTHVAWSMAVHVLEYIIYICIHIYIYILLLLLLLSLLLLLLLLLYIYAVRHSLLGPNMIKY